MPTDNIQQTGALNQSQLREINNQNTDTDYFESLGIKMPNAPVTPQVSNPALNAPQDVYSPLYDNNGDYWGRSRFDRRNPTLEETDFERVSDLRAEEQSGFNKLLNGTIKMATTAGTTFLDGTVGLVWGLGQGIANSADDNKDTTFWQGLWNNDFNKAMASAQDAMEKVAPNYYTQRELDNPWYKNIWTANFWGDKFLKNMGFTIGTMATMATGIGDLGSIAGAGVELLGKGITGSRLLKATKFANTLSKGAERAGGIAQKLVNTAVSANGEASIEAINAVRANKEAFDQNLDNWKRDRVTEANQWYSKNSGIPGARERYMQMLADIDDASIRASQENDATMDALGNSVWGMNMILLGITNNLEFGKYIKGGYNQTQSISKLNTLVNGTKTNDWKAFAKAWADGSKTAMFGADESLKKMGVGKVARIVGGTLSRNLEEGFEEGAQNLISDSGQMQAQAIVNSRMHEWTKGRKGDNLFIHSINPEVTDDLVDRGKAFMNAWQENFGTLASPGWEEVFLGALTGGLGTLGFKADKTTGKVRPTWAGGFIEEYRNSLTEYTQQEELAKELNKHMYDEKFQENVRHAVAKVSLAQDMEDSIIDNDILKFKNREMMDVAEDALYWREVGGLEMFRSFYEEMANHFTDEDVNSLKGAFRDNETGQSYFDGLSNDEIKQRMKDKAKSTLDKIDSVIESYDWHQRTYGEKVAEQAPNVSLGKQAIKTITSLDTLTKDLQRRRKELEDTLNAEEDTTEKNTIQHQINAIDNSIKQVSEQYNTYTKNPSALFEDIVKARRQLVKREVGKNAEAAKERLQSARTILDVADAYYNTDPTTRQQIFDEVYATAEPEMKNTLDSFRNYLAATQALPTIVNDRINEIKGAAQSVGEDFDSRAESNFHRILTGILDRVVETAATSEDTSFADPKKVVVDALKNEASKMRTGDGYLRSDATFSRQLDIYANELDNIADKLEAYDVVYQAFQKNTPQEEEVQQSETSSTQPQTQQPAQSAQQSAQPEEGQQSSEPQTLQTPQTPPVKNPSEVQSSPQGGKKEAEKAPAEEKKDEQKPEQKSEQKPVVQKPVNEDPEGASETPAQESEASVEAPETSMYGNSFLRYTIPNTKDGTSTRVAEEKHMTSTDWYHDVEQAEGIDVDFIQNNYLWKILSLPEFKDKDGSSRIPVRYVKFNRNVGNAGLNRFIFLATPYTEGIKSVFPEEDLQKIRTIEWEGQTYMIIGSFGTFTDMKAKKENKDVITYNEQMFDKVNDALTEQVKQNDGTPYQILEAGENGEYTNFIYQVGGGTIIRSFKNDGGESKTLKELLESPVSNPQRMSADDIVFNVIMGNEESGLTDNFINSREGENYRSILGPKYAGQVWIYLRDSTGNFVPWQLDTIDFDDIEALPEDNPVRKEVFGLIHHLAEVLADHSYAPDILKERLIAMSQLRDTLIFGSPGVQGTNISYKEPGELDELGLREGDTIEAFIAGQPLETITTNDGRQISRPFNLAGQTAPIVEAKLIDMIKALRPIYNVKAGTLRQPGGAKMLIDAGILKAPLRVLGDVNARSYVYPLNEDMTPDITFKVNQNTDGETTLKSQEVQRVWVGNYQYRISSDGTVTDSKGKEITDGDLLQAVKDVQNLKPDNKTFTYRKAPYWIVGDRAYTATKSGRFSSVDIKAANKMFDIYKKNKAEEERKEAAKKVLEEKKNAPVSEQKPAGTTEIKPSVQQGISGRGTQENTEKSTIFVDSMKRMSGITASSEQQQFFNTLDGVSDFLDSLDKDAWDVTKWDILTLMAANKLGVSDPLMLTNKQIEDAVWNSKYAEDLRKADTTNIDEIIDNIIKCGL